MKRSLIVLGILAAFVALPSAQAADQCILGGCVGADAYHTSYSTQWCLEYYAKFSIVDHTNIFCTAEPFCPNHWVCMPLFPDIRVEDLAERVGDVTELLE